MKRHWLTYRLWVEWKAWRAAKVERKMARRGLYMFGTPHFIRDRVRHLYLVELPRFADHPGGGEAG